MGQTPMHLEHAMQTSRMHLAASSSMGTALEAKGPKPSRASNRLNDLVSLARQRSCAFGLSLIDKRTTANASSAGDAGCKDMRPANHGYGAGYKFNGSVSTRPNTTAIRVLAYGQASATRARDAGAA